MSHYKRIEKMIQYLDEHRSEQPDLDMLSARAGLSPFHLHRLFSEWAGITPKTFLQCLNLTHAKQLLKGGQNVLQTALEVGLSGPGRLHDLCVRLEAASPGEIKSGGAGWKIQAGFAETPFGTCLLGRNARGICHLSFAPSPNSDEATAVLGADWPQAEVRWDHSWAADLASSIFTRQQARRETVSLKAIVQGTDFQIRVWRALLEIPPGALASYAQIAQSIGQPSATRAVASAIGQNRLGFLIPCHRVIRQTGAIGEYRWGTVRKQAMVAWEIGELAFADHLSDERKDFAHGSSVHG